MRVAIFGDSCVDMYWVGTVGGVSAEAPVPVLKQTSVSAVPGMAGNVQVLLDLEGGVETTLVLGRNPHLPIKNRLMTESGEQLARWDIEDWCTPLDDYDFDQFRNENLLQDVVIVSDYGKGAVSSALRGRIIAYCGENDIPLFVDTKNDPFQWLGVPNVTLFPNQVEYSRWKEHYDWMPSVVWKQSSRGMSYLQYGRESLHLPAYCPNPLNVCGAGDSVLAAYVYQHEAGVELALEFAAVRAGQFVSRPFSHRYESRNNSLPAEAGLPTTSIPAGEGS